MIRPIFVSVIFLLPAIVHAEAVNWSYDALGRLTQAYREDGPAAGTLTTISYDTADNRSNYTVLNVTRTLHAGDKIYSADNRFFVTLQANGQLAVVTAATNATLWVSGTASQTADRATFQADGNFIIYGAGNSVLWSTATSGNSAAQLAMRNSGDLAIVSFAGADLWHTNTGGH